MAISLSRRTLLVGAAAATLATPALAQGPRPLRIAVLGPRGIGGLDPLRATAHLDRMLMSWLHVGLVRFAPGSASPDSIGPDLAESWTVSPDRREWSFTLRRDAAVHGGGTLDAEDVVHSLRRAADPQQSGMAGDYADIERIEAPDRWTVRIQTRRPAPNLLGLLANYAGGFVLPRQAAGDSGIGAGPFRIVSHQPGEYLRLAAHGDFFRGRPKLDGIEYRFVGSLTTSDLAFQTGELDIVEGAPDQSWFTRTRALPGVAVEVLSPAEISWLHLDMTVPPLDDPRVRRAVALAVDRGALAAWRGADIARPAQGVLPSDALGFAPDGRPAAADVQGARRLLAEAGHGNGIALRTIHSTSAAMIGAIQVVQAQLARAGIRLEVELVDIQTFHQLIRRDLSQVVHYSAARFPVADVMLTQFFHGRSTVGRPGGVTNFSHCSVADELIDAARTEPDSAQQRTLWAEAQSRIAALDAAVPLLETRSVWARRSAVDYGFPLQGSMSTGPLLTEQTQLG